MNILEQNMCFVKKFECAIDAKGKNNYYNEKYNIIEHIVIQSNMISF